MSPFLRLLFGLVALVAILIGVGMTLPREVTVVRSTDLNASEAQIFPYLNDFRRFNQWSPWAQRDPRTAYTFTGPGSGVGARMEWKSDHPDVGTGSQEITVSEPNRHVETALDFGERGKGKASFDLAPAGAGTRVTWRLNADVGVNPLSRWMGLTLDRLVGADYQIGLDRLRKLVEGERAAPVSPPATAPSGPPPALAPIEPEPDDQAAQPAPPASPASPPAPRRRVLQE